MTKPNKSASSVIQDEESDTPHKLVVNLPDDDEPDVVTPIQLPNDFKNITVSRATLRPYDIAFAITMFMMVYQPALQKAVLNDDPDLAHAIAEGADATFWESDEVEFALDHLFDLMQDMAPKGTQFAAHEGNGSEFGFWEVESEEDGPDPREASINPMGLVAA